MIADGYAVETVERVLAPKEADELVGRAVDRRAATVDEPTVLLDAATGDPVIAYLRFPGDLERFRATLRSIPMGTTMRGGGMRNVSRVFGMAARSPVLRRNSCRPSGLASARPREHAILCETAVELDRLVASYAAGRQLVDRKVLADVHPDWRIADGTNWTSGVINRSSALPYHRDRANFPTLTAMPVVRRGVRGGYLHLPEYDVTLACRDGSVTIFDGKSIVHGVTPLTHVAADGYRFSVPYYALRGMRDCFSDAVEQARARDRRTAREARALDDLKALQPEEARR